MLVWRRGQLVERCPAERIAAGDLVQVADGEEVPCDMLLLKTGDVIADGVAYVETSNLDGETDLKVRRARPETNGLTITQLAALRGRFLCEPPNADLYRFDAKLSVLGSLPSGRGTGEGAQEGLPLSLALASAASAAAALVHPPTGTEASPSVRQRSSGVALARGTSPSVELEVQWGGDAVAPVHVPVSCEQLLQHGTIVRRTGWVMGMAVYTGADTKLSSNKVPPPRKVAAIDVEINRYVIAVFLVQSLLVALLGFAGTTWGGNGNAALWYLGWPMESEGHGDVNVDILSEDGAAPHTLSAAAEEGRASFGAAASAVARLLLSLPDPLTGRPPSGGHEHAWWSGLVLPLRFLLLSSMMIPISLKVSLDIAKSWHARLIARDVEMYDAAVDCPAGVANTGISEDLGRVGVVLTDKTGTLTENVMRLCALSIAGTLHGWQGIGPPDASHMRTASGSSPELIDLLQGLALCNSVAPEHSRSVVPEPGRRQEGSLLRRQCVVYASNSPDEEALVLGAARLGVALTQRRPGGEAGVERVMLAFGPRLDDGEGGGKRVWVQESGPTAAWDVLATLPFDPDRKRMSVLVRRAAGALLPQPNGDRPRAQGWGGLGEGLEAGERPVFLITKGADDALMPLLSPDSVPGAEAVHARTAAQMEVCASHGLRTLVVAACRVPDAAAAAWRVSWEAALSTVGPGRAAAVAAAMEAIESPAGPPRLHLLGASAIEDKLAEGVPETVEALRAAGIRCWMATGDKRSTAVQIARAARIIGLRQREDAPPSHVIIVPFAARSVEGVEVEVRAANEAMAALFGAVVPPPLIRVVSSPAAREQRAAGGSPPPVLAAPEAALVIEGPALRHVLASPALTQSFMALSARASAVIACRCSPAQKAGLVTAVRAWNAGTGGLTTLAIGDGGNDVAMLQAADVGVGIAGREGQQAARAADYSLARFAFLRRLLLVHGRLSHYRTAQIAQYTFYKSQALCFIQLLFSSTCGYSGCSLLDSFSLVTYNLLWTAAPGLAMLLDVDMEIETLMAQPALYADSAPWRPDEGVHWNTPAGHYLSPVGFLGWCARAAWQAVVVLGVCTAALSPTGGTGGASVPQSDLLFAVFTCLVVIQFATVLLEMRSPTRLNGLVVAGSAVMYGTLQTLRHSELGSALERFAEAVGATFEGGATANALGSAAVGWVQRGLPGPGWVVLLPTMALAIGLAIAPWLPSAPRFRTDARSVSSIDGLATHASPPARRRLSISVLSPPPSIAGQLAGAASAVREQGRVVAGAVQQAASAAVAGDRRAFSAALSVAGRAVRAVGRRGASRSYRDEEEEGDEERGATSRNRSIAALLTSFSTDSSTPSIADAAGSRDPTPGTGSKAEQAFKPRYV
jgi:magnesium-transporting ATPase (P-type)